MEDFEDPELLRIKPTRTKGEYCWTCTPSIILYSIDKFQLDSCIYVDADICFYNDPQVLVDEMQEASVLITEHRYSPSYNLSIESGKYCVQFMVFKNDEKGKIVLNWWRERCIEWCYARHEDGKFGDQKYLDDWLTRFEGVHSLKHLGGGVAPWNIEQYDFMLEDGILKGIELSSQNKFDLIFYHFHALKLYKYRISLITSESYGISPNNFQLIYQPYIKKLETIIAELLLEDLEVLAYFRSKNSTMNYLFFLHARLKNYIRKMLAKKLNSNYMMSNYIKIK
ncbi:MAG: glycosyl transferase [Pelobium sp.]